MFKNKKHTDIGKSIPFGLAMGITVNLVITVLGAMLAAWMISAEKVGESSMDLLLKIIHLVSASTGAWIASALVKKLRLQMCLLTGLGYYLTLLAMTALFFNGQYHGLGITGVLIAVGCIAVALIPVNKVSVSGLKKRGYR